MSAKMITTLCRFMHDERRLSLPLLEKLFAAEFTLVARRPGEEFSISDHQSELAGDPDAMAAHLGRFAAVHDGELTLGFAGQPVLRFAYGDNWRVTVDFDFFERGRLDLPRIQEKLFELFEMEDFERFMDLGTGFLARAVGEPFHYELRQNKAPFLVGDLRDYRLVLRLVDIPAYLKMVFFLVRQGDPLLFVRSPLDILKLADQAQDAIRYMADAYEEKGLTLGIEYNQETVFRCGRDVKPSLGARFGATALQIDALARILKSAWPGRGE
ncbi:MAG: hypothetical protein GX444_11895 [Myxococcales bacterium]|nr:hypothetical protein [Myxococcales bacterium]